MATPGMWLFGQTGDRFIDAMTHGYYWALNSDRTVDWSVSNGPFDQTWASTAQAAEYINQALVSYSYYANINFNYMGWFIRPSVAASSGSEINFAWAGLELFPSPRWGGVGYFPTAGSNVLYAGQAGDVFFNTASGAGSASYYGLGSDVYALFLHEMGHVIGLKHPHDDGGTGRPTLDQLGLGDWDIDFATVMSYDDDYPTEPRQWNPATPMILDVLALQYIYGKNMSTNAGSSLYGVARTNFYATYWDASGNDTITAAGQQEGWVIVLPNTQLSTIVNTKAGYALPGADLNLQAPTTLYWLAGDIENATGSDFGDFLAGSDGANQLIGNGGDDVLEGLGGDDLIFGGAGVDYAAYENAIGQYRITSTSVTHKTGFDGVDLLSSIERLVFTDKTVDLSVASKVALVSASTLQSIVELYVAFFNRVPDSEGMSYWIGQAAAGVSIPTIANSFYGAAVQYSSLTGYSASMTNADFVNVIYRNVLGRSSADAAGLAYWSGALANGSETRGTLVKSILDSAHTFKGHATYGWVADLLDNKYAVGKLFSVDMGLSFNTPQESISEGMRIAAAVTPFDTSAAISLIGVSPADIHLT